MDIALEDDLKLLEAAALLAGEAALPYFRIGGSTTAKVSYKDGNSPVSEADHAANDTLERHLRRARPSYQWVSEETVDAIDRLTATHLFVVDPIDGTRAFIAGQLQWSVSVALVVNGAPLAGVIHAPSLGVTYSAARGLGAYRNGSLIKVSQRRELQDAMVSGGKQILEQLQEATGKTVVAGPKIPSLALRLALAADSGIDLALAATGAHDWDVAAADIILQESGGVLLDTDGERLIYNRPSLRRGPLGAGPADLAGQAARALGLRR
jgi:myo-inositol-1(or 4)-monophosphatase